jgi:hypothetical protein
MSRIKKSRKPKAARIATPAKTESKKIVLTHDRKPKKHTGQKPGNRQQEGLVKSRAEQPAQAKDPRVGSKKPIDLGKPVAIKNQATDKPRKSKPTPIAKVTKVDNLAQYEAELEALESDERLLAIVAKQEDDIELTEVEIDYFNEKMDRHQQLQTLLGIEEENDELESSLNSDDDSDDSLWQRFDNNDLSKF